MTNFSISTIVKTSVLILSLALLINYLNDQKASFPLIEKIIIPDIRISSLEDLFVGMKFLKFHPCVRNIEIIEKIDIDGTPTEIYEITEEAKVFFGLYTFRTKNKMHVERISKYHVRTKLTMSVLGIWKAEFSNQFIAHEVKENENVSVVFEEKGTIYGISYAMYLIKYYTEHYHHLMFIRIKEYMLNLLKS